MYRIQLSVIINSRSAGDGNKSLKSGGREAFVRGVDKGNNRCISGIMVVDGDAQ